jgi:hypothetical protein
MPNCRKDNGSNEYVGLTFGPLFASRSSPLTSSAEYRRSLRHRLLRMCIFSAGSLGGLGFVSSFLYYLIRLNVEAD